VVDSRNAAISEGFLSMEALRLIKEGQKTKDIIEYLTKLRAHRKQYFMVDNLRLFVKNGRLSGASGFVGSMFKIKPILEVNDEGKIVPFKKIRTQKRALKEMVELVIEDLKNIDDFIVTYNTSNNLEGLAYVKERMEEAYPGYRYIEAPITPVIGCHTGVGTVGIAYFDLNI
jgi:DegV family protein with EDD domain